jgi:hypothetical protein
MVVSNTTRHEQKGINIWHTVQQMKWSYPHEIDVSNNNGGLFTRQQLPNQMYINKPILIHTVTTIQFLSMFIKPICYPKTTAKFCLWVMPSFHCLWTGVSVWGSQHHMTGTGLLSQYVLRLVCLYTFDWVIADEWRVIKAWSAVVVYRRCSETISKFYVLTFECVWKVYKPLLVLLDL